MILKDMRGCRYEFAYSDADPKITWLEIYRYHVLEDMRNSVLVSCGDLSRGVKFGDLFQMTGPRDVAVVSMLPSTVKFSDPAGFCEVIWW